MDLGSLLFKIFQTFLQLFYHLAFLKVLILSFPLSLMLDFANCVFHHFDFGLSFKIFFFLFVVDMGTLCNLAVEISFGSVQSLNCVQFFTTPWTAALRASLSFTISWSLLKLMSIELMDTIHPSHPLLSPSLPALNLSQHQGLFYWVGFSHQVGKVLEPQFQHQSFQ